MVGSQSDYEDERLLRQVREKRGELYDLASKYSLTSQTVVKCSQELDKLLNRLSFEPPMSEDTRFFDKKTRYVNK